MDDDTKWNYSSIGSRFWAVLIDNIIVFVFVFIMLMLPIRIVSEGLIGDLAVLLIFIGYFGYFTLLEGNGGQTLGKKILGIKVVKEDGTPCDFRSALIRNILRCIDVLPIYYIIALISMAQSVKTQRLGDRAAKTIVIRIK